MAHRRATKTSEITEMTARVEVFNDRKGKNKETRSAPVVDQRPTKRQQAQPFQPPPLLFGGELQQSRNHASIRTYKNNQTAEAEPKENGYYYCKQMRHIKRHCPKLQGAVSQSVNGPQQ